MLPLLVVVVVLLVAVVVVVVVALVIVVAWVVVGVVVALMVMKLVVILMMVLWLRRRLPGVTLNKQFVTSSTNWITAATELKQQPPRATRLSRAQTRRQTMANSRSTSNRH